MSETAQERAVVDAATQDDDEGSATGVWATVGLFVAFVVLGSSCIALQLFS
ncbi:hypothetical protein [Microbacterium sp.]|uniref:hypothetical protein n=1 Tax=Microbacterium sp. TaxID=51671 RepID=UPI0039E6E32E